MSVENQPAPLSLHSALRAYKIGISEQVATAFIVKSLSSEALDENPVVVLSSTLENIFINESGEVNFEVQQDKTINENEYSHYNQLINHLCILIYQALDYGIGNEQERELSKKLEDVISFMSINPEDAIQSDTTKEETKKKIFELCEIHLSSLEGDSKKIDEDFFQKCTDLLCSYYKDAIEVIAITEVMKIKKRKAKPSDKNSDKRQSLRNSGIFNSMDSLISSVHSNEEEKTNTENTIQNDKKSIEKTLEKIPVTDASTPKQETKMNIETALKIAEVNKIKDKLITTKHNIIPQEEKMPRRMIVAELSKTQTNIQLANFDMMGASQDFLSVLHENIICIYCTSPFSDKNSSCILCSFGICFRHRITAFLPLKPIIGDNFVDAFLFNYGENNENNNKIIENYIKVELCPTCANIVLEIKEEYQNNLKKID